MTPPQPRHSGEREGRLSPQNPASYIRFLPWTGYPLVTKWKVWGGVRWVAFTGIMNYHSPHQKTKQKFLLVPSQEWDYLEVSGKGGARAESKKKPLRRRCLHVQ